MGKRITAIDLGTHTISVLVCEEENDGIRVIAYERTNSDGIKKGIIYNIQKTMIALRMLINKIQEEKGITINEAVVNISGRLKRCEPYSFEITRREPNSFISAAEIAKMNNEAMSYPVKGDEKVLYAIPTTFDVDNYIGKDFKDLEGSIGRDVICNYNLMIGRAVQFNNIKKLFESLKINVTEYILTPIASARSILTKDERELGVAVIEIGAGTTNVIVIKEDQIKHIAVIPFAGASITEDIRIATSTSSMKSEIMKVKYGTCLESSVLENKTIVVKDNLGGREDKMVSFKDLSHYIEARVTEILEAVLYEIKENGLMNGITAGIVITGGSSHLKRISELAESIFKKSVRIAIPSNKFILSESNKDIFSPNAVTIAGLALCERDRLNGIDYPPAPDNVWIKKNSNSVNQGEFKEQQIDFEKKENNKTEQGVKTTNGSEEDKKSVKKVKKEKEPKSMREKIMDFFGVSKNNEA